MTLYDREKSSRGVELPGAGQLGRQVSEPFGTVDAGHGGVTQQARHISGVNPLGDQRGCCPAVAVPGDVVQGSVELGAGFYAGQGG